MQVLRVLSLPTSIHHLAGSCQYQQREKTTKWKQQLTMAVGGPRQRPRRRGDRSNSWRAIPVRDREQDSKRAYLCSLLLHQARKFKDNFRSVAT
ncbi:hypothetical protein L6452_37290 [Arctium lappa]|uniref:Uncharacterized protein n=1 Tax=Arctium lappa TaxID=4217 RepID=A0ACB8Y1W7_ARCLA|nr:hypothetical protein L6452_37290 [Arctium lappa]